jgi:hypothetical protein
VAETKYIFVTGGVVSSLGKGIISAVVEANTNDGKYYRLFAPLTFYHGVSENMFALEKNGDEQDRTLANIYLNRPDLVRNTQRQLDLVGPVVNPYPESKNNFNFMYRFVVNITIFIKMVQR